MKERKTYLSLARVIGAWAVVIIHTNICFPEFNLNRCWIWGNVLETSFGFAVPLFVMVSGATLMDYSRRYSTKEYFKKRIIKTLIPYYAWGFVSYLLGVNVFMIYFFFINLFGVYLCIPVFSFIKEEYKEKVMKYVVMVAFVLNYMLPFLCKITGKEFAFAIPFDIAQGYLIYALIGYLIYKNDISKKWRLVSYLGSMIGYVLYVGGTHYISIQTGAANELFRGYTNLPCLLTSVGIFVFIKQIGQRIKNEKLIHAIEWLSGYTFPIYMIHYFVIKLLIEKVFEEYIHTVPYILGTPFLTIAISVVIAWVLRKMPIVKYILP